MSDYFTEHPGELLPYVCECGLTYRYAISASWCCDPAAPGEAD